MKFDIIQDSREKQPWKFKEHKVTVEKLDSADYSLRGLEKVFAIERKMTVSEISNNILEARFERELERLDKYKFAFMVCEFTWDDIIMFPIGSSIPKSIWHKIKIKSEFIRSALTRYQLEHNIKIIFAGKNGDLAALELFKHITRMEENGKI